MIGAPREAVEVVWSAILLTVTGGYMLVSEHGDAGLPLALLAGGLLVSAAAGGNVEPLLVGALYFGIHRSSGPVWVGVAASIKLVPILYVIPWIGRREWGKALIAIGIMGVGLDLGRSVTLCLASRGHGGCVSAAATIVH